MIAGYKRGTLVAVLGYHRPWIWIRIRMEKWPGRRRQLARAYDFVGSFARPECLGRLASQSQSQSDTTASSKSPAQGRGKRPAYRRCPCSRGPTRGSSPSAAGTTIGRDAPQTSQTTTTRRRSPRRAPCDSATATATTEEIAARPELFYFFARPGPPSESESETALREDGVFAECREVRWREE